jgi:hypothetical protein
MKTNFLLIYKKSTNHEDRITKLVGLRLPLLGLVSYLVFSVEYFEGE